MASEILNYMKKKINVHPVAPRKMGGGPKKQKRASQNSRISTQVTETLIAGKSRLSPYSIRSTS